MALSIVASGTLGAIVWLARELSENKQRQQNAALSIITGRETEAKNKE